MKRIFILILSICLPIFLFTGCKSQPTKTAAVPFVIINDSIFIIDSKGTTTAELSDEYMEIGAVTEKTSGTDTSQNGASSCCDIGDKIYQSSDEPNEIFVYTKLFSEKEEYRYLKFNKAENLRKH